VSPFVVTYNTPAIRVRTDLPKVEGRDQLELTEDATYTIHGDMGVTHRVIVPRGFLFDGASIPRALWWFASPVNDWLAGAVLHDYLYYTRCCRRAVADDFLRQIVSREGHSKTYVSAVYNAVRWGGKGAWLEGDSDAARKELSDLTHAAGYHVLMPWENPYWQAEDWSVIVDYEGAAE
jgi:hypothetical protein